MHKIVLLACAFVVAIQCCDTPAVGIPTAQAMAAKSRAASLDGIVKSIEKRVEQGDGHLVFFPDTYAIEFPIPELESSGYQQTVGRITSMTVHCISWHPSGHEFCSAVEARLNE